MRVRPAVAGALAVVVCTLAVVLLDSEPRLAASNSHVTASLNSVGLRPGEQRCQGGEFVPADADRLHVYPGFEGRRGPALELRALTARGREAFRTPVAAGYPSGLPLEIALPGGRPSVELGRLCLRNRGSEVVGFAGNLISANPATGRARSGPGQRNADEVRVDYYLPGEPRWISVADRVVDRAALFRPAFMGAWTLWLVLFALAAVCAVAVRFLVRQLEEDA